MYLLSMVGLAILPAEVHQLVVGLLDVAESFVLLCYNLAHVAAGSRFDVRLSSLNSSLVSFGPENGNTLPLRMFLTLNSSR